METQTLTVNSLSQKFNGTRKKCIQCKTISMFSINTIQYDTINYHIKQLKISPGALRSEV